MRGKLKFCLLLCFALGLIQLSFAQFTAVSGTVTDPNGLPYAGGTITATLVISGTPIFSATNLPYTPPTQPVGLNSAGTFTMQLADVTALRPSGGAYTFQVCSSAATVQPAIGKGSVCFTVTGVSILGTSQSITSTLTAAALALTIPIGVGGSVFSAITSGVNTSATMTVGTGASLGFSGSGTINANQLLGAAVPSLINGCLTNTSGTLSWNPCIDGSIANQQVAYGSGAGTIQGSSNFTFDGTNLTLNSTTAGTAFFNPAIFQANYNGSGTNGQVIGLFGIGQNTGTGTITRLVGMSCTVHNPGGGTITEADACEGGTSGVIGGTVPLYIDFRFLDPQATGATNFYSVVFNNGVNAIAYQNSPGNPITGSTESGQSGNPNGVYSAPVGSVFWRSDGGIGSSEYIKETGSGNTGWDPVVTSTGALVAGQPLGSNASLLASSIPEVRSSLFAPGTSLSTLLSNCPASPTPCKVILDAATSANFIPVTAATSIGSSTQVVDVDDHGVVLQCQMTNGTDCIDIQRWGKLHGDLGGPASSSNGCLITSSTTAVLTSLVTNGDHTGAQAGMAFEDCSISPSAQSLVTKATLWLSALEGNGHIRNIAPACKPGGIALLIEDGPATGDSNTLELDSVGPFGSAFPGCIPFVIQSTTTGTGQGANIVCNGCGAVDAVIAPISMTTTAAISSTGVQSVAVNNTTNVCGPGAGSCSVPEQATITGSDGHTEVVNITTFSAGASVTANFTLTHVLGSTIATGNCWDGNGCMLNIDGAAGGSGSHFVAAVTFNNLYMEGEASSVSTGNWAEIRNCKGCILDNVFFSAGTKLANFFHLGFSSTPNSTGFTRLTAGELGDLATNWVTNDVDTTSLASIGGGSLTYVWPGPVAKTTGYVVDGIVVPAVNALASLPSCTAASEGGHVVANNCNAGCSAGGTCTAGGTTHCELYCNSTPAYLETGR